MRLIHFVWPALLLGVALPGAMLSAASTGVHLAAGLMGHDGCQTEATTTIVDAKDHLLLEPRLPFVSCSAMVGPHARAPKCNVGSSSD